MVRQLVGQLAKEIPNLHYLSQDGVHQLDEHRCLIGHDGWGDARNGDFLQTPIRLNDHRFIQDFKQIPRPVLQKKLQALGDQAAHHLASLLPQASEQAAEIWVVTHVPPFPETCWYNGYAGHPDWIPDFSCQAVGNLLLQFCAANPSKQVKVFSSGTWLTHAYFCILACGAL